MRFKKCLSLFLFFVLNYCDIFIYKMLLKIVGNYKFLKFRLI